MPIRVFESLSVITVAITLWAMAKKRSPRALLGEYAALAVAGFVGEETMIQLYRFYHYSPSWDARLLDVPVLVPLIWPLVVLSACDVVESLSRRSALKPSAALRSLLVASFVVFDASLVEVVAVRAGLWSWAEPGHLSVPIIGILGWGFFAFGAVLPLLVARDRVGPRAPLSPSVLLGAIVLGPIVAHAAVLASWWSLFRWTLRGDLGSTTTSILLLGVPISVVALVARRAGYTIAIDVAAPRIVAALLFFALLVTTADGDHALFAHTAVVAVAYICLTQTRRTTVSQHQRR
jgi:hypothetical protein